MRIKIDVTPEDIAKGYGGSTCHCPVARAVNRALDYKINATVYSLKLLLTGPYGVVGFNHTKKVKAFIAAFDDGCTVAPFSFTLNLRKSHVETLGIPYER